MRYESREARYYLRPVQPFEMWIQLIFSASGLNGSVLWKSRVHWQGPSGNCEKTLEVQCSSGAGAFLRGPSAGRELRAASRLDIKLSEQPSSSMDGFFGIQYLSNSVSTCSKEQITHRSAILHITICICKCIISANIMVKY